MKVPFIARRSMVCVPIGNSLFFYGGVGGRFGTEGILDVSNELWEYRVDSCDWREIECTDPMPEPRRCPGAFAHGGAFQIWGGSGIDPTGESHTFLNDWWSYDPVHQTWSRIEQLGDNVPCPRYFPVFEPIDSKVLLFGGYSEVRKRGGERLGDCWIYDSGQWRETSQPAVEVEKIPEARYGMMAASEGDRVYMFGGCGEMIDLNDLWEFDIQKESWVHLDDQTHASGPAPRYCGSFVHYGEKLVLFGGRSRLHPKLNFSDLWTFCLRTRKWEQIHSHSEEEDYQREKGNPCYHAKAASAVLGANLYIMGGEGLSGHVSDFWRLNLETYEWTCLAGGRDDDPVFW